MSRGLQEIQRDRRRLQARSRIARARLTGHALAVQRPLALADKVYGGVRQALARPAWSVGMASAVVGLVAMLGPRRALAWGAKGWTAWRLWRRLLGTRSG